MATSLLKKYNSLQKSIQEYLETIEPNNFSMGYSPHFSDTDNFFVALASDLETKTYNSTSAMVPFNLELKTENDFKTFSVYLPNIYDAYDSMEFLLYPNEDVKSINLILEKNLDDQDNHDPIILKTIDNITTGSFSFFPTPIYTLPNYSLKIDVIFDNITSVYNRILWIKGIIYTTDIQKSIKTIYTENPTEEQILKTLKTLHICPVCKEKANFSCNCPKRDSKCSNGHSWYYNKRENKIITGSIQH